jgi:hypothetical protein
MKNLVNRKNGYLEIDNVNSTRQDTKREMYYLLEKINNLEDLVKKGKTAEEELKELDEKFKELCKKVVEEQ